MHRAALQALTAQAAPNYSAMAVVLRSLLDLCTGDPERLALLAEAAGLLDAAPQVGGRASLALLPRRSRP